MEAALNRVGGMMDGVSENYWLDVSRVIQHICLTFQMRTVRMLKDLLEETQLQLIK